MSKIFSLDSSDVILLMNHTQKATLYRCVASEIRCKGTHILPNTEKSLASEGFA